MWTASFYVNYHLSYFKQWNLDKDINFPNSSIDSKLGFLSVGLRLELQILPN